MSNVTTAVEILETLLNLPAQLDRIEAAATTRQPIDVTLITGNLPPTGYVLEATEFALIQDGAKLGQISQRWNDWSWSWNQGDQEQGTWELHRGISPTREDAIAAIIEHRPDPNPYRGKE